ncbi:MAG: hypothetical protein ACE5KT_11300, partial [Methanosarcinales archaeon]
GNSIISTYLSIWFLYIKILQSDQITALLDSCLIMELRSMSNSFIPLNPNCTSKSRDLNMAVAPPQTRPAPTRPSQASIGCADP